MTISTDQGLRYDGFYRGIVVQHCDHGKCKVFIPTVYAQEYADDPNKLPLAEQASPLFGGTNNGNGMFSYPNIGTVVWCFFQNGDINLPVYFAATLGGPQATNQKDEGFLRVRNNVQHSSDAKQDTTINGEDSQQHMITCGDTRVILRESGQIEIFCKIRPLSGEDAAAEKSEDEEKKKKFTHIFMDASGSIQIDAKESIQIKTPLLKIDAEDQVEINTTSFVLRANNEVQINAKQMATVNENSHTVISPSINMDASQGKFVAKGAKHAPLFIT